MSSLEGVRVLGGYVVGMIHKLTHARDLVTVRGWDERNRMGRLRRRSGDRSGWACCICAAMVFVGAFTAGRVDGAGRTVRVGVYQNKPKVFMDENGRAAGFFIELLDEMAAIEGWTLVYVPCEWSECLVALEEGRIDLMPDVAYSLERDQKYDFHRIPVTESWSQVYAHPRAQVNGINDLDGRRVAILKDSIQQTVFEQYMRGFGFEVAILPTGSLEEAFNLAANGSADAAIANHFFGDFFYRSYGLVKTTIVFNAATLYYATARGRNSDLLEAIDRHLGAWIEEPNSVYYQTLSRWMEKPPVYLVPQYVGWVIGITIGLLVVSGGMILLLRGQVRARTRHLEQANKMLQRTEEMLRLAMEATYDGIWDWYPQSGQIYWSTRSYTMLGYQPDEFPMNLERWAELLHPDDRESAREAVQRQINTGNRSFSIEFRHRRKDGGWAWINGRGKAVELDDDGAIQRVIGTYTDITERKQAEEALRKSEERYRLISTVASDYMFSTRLEADGRLALNWVAGAFETITEYTFEEYIARGGWRAALHPDDLAVDDRDMEKLRTNQPVVTEVRTLTKSGRMVWVRVYAHPVWDAERKELVGVYGAVQDITERKRAEEALQALSRQLLEAQEMERRRVACELHDEIGQVLTAVKMNLQAVQMSPDPAVALARLGESIGIVDRALKQVRDLALDLRPSLLDDFGLVPALEWLVERQSEQLGLDVEFTAEPDDLRLPATIETTCFRVVQAALTNVARHAQAQHAHVELRLRGTELELVVRDDGIGFDVRAALERAARGASIGLLGMQERVRLAGGQMDIESAPGRGTQVHVCLPIKEGDLCDTTQGV